ncbi:MAG TPA: mechanosensitive ion channel family protein [Gemmatimonadales bacterium]|nr:mechanosensitive ion channel family protein [Gemmatimonadales bacterium]
MLLLPRWLENLGGLFGADGALVLQKASKVITIWLLAWLVLALVRLVAKRIEAVVNDQNELVTTAREKRGRTISQLVRGAGRIVVLLGAVLLTLNVFMSIAPVLAGVGIFGLAISFGAQSLVKDIITGFFMLLENQFGVGDVIEAGGKSGSVEEFTLRLVKLRALDGTLHMIPNGEIKAVSNMTRGWSRAVIDVDIGHETPPERALEVLRDEARKFSKDPKYQFILDAPLEVTGIESLSRETSVIRVLAKTKPGMQWGLARDFRLALKERLDKEGISIPYPLRAVSMRLVPTDEEAAKAMNRLLQPSTTPDAT